MPYGYLLGTLIFATMAALAIRPISRPRWAGRVSWLFSMSINELPFLAAALIVASTALTFADGNVGSPGAWFAVAMSAVVLIALGVIAARALQARDTIERSLRSDLGVDRPDLDLRDLPWPRILLAPWLSQRSDVVRISGVPYGNGARNQLDVYRPRLRVRNAPALLFLHGGRFRRGGKSREAKPLLYRLAAEGWVCFSANYHVSDRPASDFPAHLIDVKRAIGWIREMGREFGADGRRVVVAGSSAGAHLSTMAALTPNEPELQPGFEHLDTSADAAIGLYGYYGGLGREAPASSPLAHIGPGAPPLFVAHGDQDTFTPPEDARRLAEEWRRNAEGPVVYAELPGAQHSFDVFHSIRFDTLIEGIVVFAEWLKLRRTY